MARSYSEQSYGGRRTVKMGPGESLTTASNASAATILQHTFMYPCKVLDFNVELIAGGTDLTAATAWTVAKSLGGTGTATAFGTADMLGSTATHADFTTVDGSATETSFVAGDDVLFQMEGTPASTSVVAVNLEVQEVFVESDS